MGVERFCPAEAGRVCAREHGVKFFSPRLLHHLMQQKVVNKCVGRK